MGHKRDVGFVRSGDVPRQLELEREQVVAGLQDVVSEVDGSAHVEYLPAILVMVNGDTFLIALASIPRKRRPGRRFCANSSSAVRVRTST